MNNLDSFSVGTKYKSYKQLTKAINLYQESSQLSLISRNNSYLKEEHLGKVVANQERLLNDLRYYKLNFLCEFGKEEESKQEYRTTFTKKIGCPFRISFISSKYCLVVTELVLHVDHVCTTFKRPKLDDSILKEISVCCKTRAPTAQIANHIIDTYALPVLNKDIHNVSKQIKIPEDQSPNAYSKLLESNVLVEIKNPNGFVVAYVVQTERMKNIWKCYSDILLMDSTFGLLVKKWSYFVILSINGEGQTEPVTWFVVKDETSKHLGLVFEYLKTSNNFELTQCFYTDKDFSERKVIRYYFKNAVLGLCLFHVKKAIQRMFTRRNLNLDDEEKKEELQKFDNLMLCRNQDEIEVAMAKFSSKTYPYVKKNWYGITSEFIDGMKPANRHLGVRTTGRCESFFNHLKNFSRKKTTIEILVKDSANFVRKQNLKNDKDIKGLYLRKPTKVDASEIDECKTFLTYYGFAYLTFLLVESKKICKVPLDANNNCTVCLEQFQIGLPCLHQLTNRTDTYFIKEKSNRRWFKKTLIDCYDLPKQYNSEIYLCSDNRLQVNINNNLNYNREDQNLDNSSVYSNDISDSYIEDIICDEKRTTSWGICLNLLKSYVRFYMKTIKQKE